MQLSWDQGFPIQGITVRHLLAGLLLISVLTARSHSQEAPRKLTPKETTTTSVNRLVGELLHPNQDGHLTGLQFSPDGKRLIAGSYPNGVVVVWDLETRKRLVTVPTESRNWGFEVTHDLKTLYVSRFKGRKREWIDIDGVRQPRWESDGDVRAWDLDTGNLTRTYRHEPPRGIHSVRLLPGETTLLSSDELSGVSGALQGSITLWNAASGKHRSLAAGFEVLTIDSQGKFMAAAKHKPGDQYAEALCLVDLLTLTEKWNVPVKFKTAWLELACFSPDGSLLVGDLRVFQTQGNWDNWDTSIKWWGSKSGKEVLSLDTNKKEAFYFKFSPDGRKLVAVSAFGQQKRVDFFDVAERRLRKTLQFEQPAPGLKQLLGHLPQFSADGRWLVVNERVFPEKADDKITPFDCPQPRIHIIDSATGEIRETIVSPPGFGNAICFSPDGRRLASCGYGKVLLWDVADLKLK